MEKPIFIHYGHNNFDKNKFIPIKNRKDIAVKPVGGLWACRKNSSYNWKDWCIREDFEKDRLKKSFEFEISKSSRVLTITNHKELNNLRKRDDISAIAYTALDFEQLSKEYDAIEVFISKDNQLYFDLYGWDCDSILILNPNCIEIVNG